MTTTVVHCKREPFDVLIDRRTKWGNPFVIGIDGNREEVIEKYLAWILSQPELLDALDELRGKRLGCWCDPQHCHGHVLAQLADGRRCQRCGGPMVESIDHAIRCPCATCEGDGWIVAAAHDDRCTGDCENHGCPIPVQEPCPDCTQDGP